MITPQLALRVAILGGIAFALFAIVFFRLWFLQVLSGEEYVSEARANKARNIKIEAPRGDIVDRHGDVLVKTKEAAVVQIEADRVPEVEAAIAEAYQAASSAAERERLRAAAQADRLARRERRQGEPTTRADRRELARLERAGAQARAVRVPPLPREALEARRLYRRLGRVIDVSPRRIHERVVKSIALTPYADVTVRTGVSRDAYNYLLERQADFPGVRPTRTFLRDYPFERNGAHLFGTLAEISPEQLDQKRYRDVEAGTRIGSGGLEEEYDRWLRGTDGFTRVSIDAQGRPRDEIAATRREPRQGNQLQLSLDIGLERTADRAMQRAIGATGISTAGGYVALNPETGEIYAMGSYPSFDANLFAKPLSNTTFDRLNSEANGSPLFNRALSGRYPTGSTFKPITAVAALESGQWKPSDSYFDSGAFKLGNQTRYNARKARYGATDLVKSLEVSVDTFYYNLGLRLNDVEGRPLQTWARRLGLGRRTGIDLPEEPAGLVPDAAWRRRGFRAYERCRAREDVTYGSFAALLACGGIDRPWSAGDNVSLAIGQGDLQATPLQMAVAYSAIANGGRIVRPQLGREVQDGQGVPVQDLQRSARRTVDIRPGNRAAIMEGLRRAATGPNGTSTGVFKGFGGDVYGKTGTVQRDGQEDQSWYAAYANQQDRPIVVVTTIEKGGFGSETAAPAACRILAKWYDKRAPCQATAVE